MLRNIWALFALLLLVACASELERTRSTMIQPDDSAWLSLRQGLKSLDLGDYLSGRTAFDRVLTTASPGDSQLVFLGVYYGVRCRVMSGLKSSADSLYDYWKPALPPGQTTEIELVLGRVRPQADRDQLASEEHTARTIGVILPLSGQFSEFGTAILEGIKLAVEQHNAVLPEENHVFLKIIDDGSDQIRVASLGRQLATDSSIVALIGSHGNETSMAIALVASAAGIPLVCPTADAPGMDNLGPMVHIINRTDPVMAVKLAEYAVDKLGFQTFAIVAPDDEYGKLLGDTFAGALKERGAALVMTQRYSDEIKNFEKPMNLLRRYLPDAIYLPVHSNEVTQVASQVYYYGLDQVHMLGTELWNNDRVIRMGGDYVNGAVFVAPFYEDSPDLRWNEFKDIYESTYRRPVNRFSALGFDSAELLLSAAGKLPVGRRLLAEKLNSIKGHKGIMGVYTVEPSGDVKRDAFILEISGGKIVSPTTSTNTETDSTAPSIPQESPLKNIESGQITP
jgi:branched-chain amino acid transport system substrate-binding protein